MQTIPFAGGARIVAVPGLCTARLGDRKVTRDDEVCAVGHALRLGCRLIDSAELCGAGGAEDVVGAALAASGLARDAVLVVWKVHAHRASRAGVQAACRRSLQQLGRANFDLDLLHWRGAAPRAGTVAGFEDLWRDRLIRHWGISNFDAADLEALWHVPDGSRCAGNQMYCALTAR